MGKHDKPVGKITVPEIQDALQRSGYLLESRLERILRERVYLVDPNWTYPDPETRKGRELDVHALGWPNNIGNDFSIGVELFVECVNNPQPLVFFTRAEDGPSFAPYALRCLGWPRHISLEPGKSNPVLQALNVEEFHHHCSGRFATQFCSFQPKRNVQPPEWMALHDDDHHAALKKLGEAVLYAEQRDDLEGEVDLRVAYPVLVLQGDLLEVNPWTREPKPRPATRVQFRRSVISNGEPEELYIDVVTEGSFRRFLRVIEAEAAEALKRMRGLEAEFRAAAKAVRPKKSA